MALSQAFQSVKRTSHTGNPLPPVYETDASKDQREERHDGDTTLSIQLMAIYFHAGTLNDMCVREFHDCLSKSADVAVAVAAIRALTLVIRYSAAQTIMGLSKELEEAAQALQRFVPCMHGHMGHVRH